MSLEETAEDIRTMRIRGAGRIARAAAAALRDVASDSPASSPDELRAEFDRAFDLLASTRPTAVSLINGLRNVKAKSRWDGDLEDMRMSIRKAAEEFIQRSELALETIGTYGSRRIKEGSTILTHCNSHAALACILQAHRDGKRVKVFSRESRPRYQGHITSRELAKEGVDVTLIVDSAGWSFMKDVDLIFVGADTITSDGRVINKIGTAPLAILAHHASVPFMVCAESYKFSPDTLTGNVVEIEYRDPGEVADRNDFPGINILNPAFDITPAEYVTSIITELGIISPHAAYDIIVKEFPEQDG